MRHHFIFCALSVTVAISSCKKGDVLGPGGVGVYKEYSVFPLKEGDVWRCDVVSYSWLGAKTYDTYHDTIKGPQKRNDGKEYYRFFNEFYTLLDNRTLQTSFDNHGFWTNEVYAGEYIWFADRKTIDTLSSINYYHDDTSPEKALTIAYPDDTMINGLKCKRTEVVYFYNHNNEDHYAGKRMVYFSMGNGPVYEVQYWPRYDPKEQYSHDKKLVEKVWEKFYKQVVFAND